VTMLARQSAEWERAKVVLLAEPNFETLFGLLETNSANFLYPFDLKKAREEHRAFRKSLERFGAKVIDLREALVSGCLKEGEALESENLEKLREFAGKSLRYEFSAEVSEEDRKLLLKNKDLIIRSFHPTVLADLVLLRPKLMIRYNPHALDPTSRLKVWASFFKTGYMVSWRWQWSRIPERKWTRCTSIPISTSFPGRKRSSALIASRRKLSRSWTSGRRKEPLRISLTRKSAPCLSLSIWRRRALRSSPSPRRSRKISLQITFSYRKTSWWGSGERVRISGGGSGKRV